MLVKESILCDTVAVGAGVSGRDHMCLVKTYTNTKPYAYEDTQLLGYPTKVAYYFVVGTSPEQSKSSLVLLILLSESALGTLRVGHQYNMEIVQKKGGVFMQDWDCTSGALLQDEYCTKRWGIYST